MNLLEYRSQWPMLRPYYLAKFKNRIIECISFPWKQDNTDLINIRKPGDPTSLETIEISELTQVRAICSQCQRKFHPYYYSTNKLQCPECEEHYRIENLKFE